MSFLIHPEGDQVARILVPQYQLHNAGFEFINSNLYQGSSFEMQRRYHESRFGRPRAPRRNLLGAELAWKYVKSNKVISWIPPEICDQMPLILFKTPKERGYEVWMQPPEKKRREDELVETFLGRQSVYINGVDNLERMLQMGRTELKALWQEDQAFLYTPVDIDGPHAA